MDVRGLRVVLTRAAEDSTELAERLSHLGATVVAYPCIRALPDGDPDEIEAAFSALETKKVGWVAFASRNGVRYFARRAGEWLGSFLSQPRVAVVGPGTADELRAVHGEPDLIARESTAEGLAQAILSAGTPASGEVLLPSAAKGRRVLGERLKEGGFQVRKVTVYRTVVAGVEAPHLFPESPPTDMDVVVFTSPSTVSGFLNRVSSLDSVRIVSIGPTTSQALRERGITNICEAKQHDMSGLLEIFSGT